MAKNCHFYDDEVCHLCEELLVSCDRKCDLAILVENLYTAGYRKASDIAREIFAEIEKVFGVDLWLGSTPWKYADYERLKQKYTEGE